MVKLSQIEEYKNRKKTSGFSPRLGTKIYTTGGILRGTAPHHFFEFVRLQGTV